MPLYIVVSVHQGRAHLRELMASVLAQTDDSWHLLARDDGSSDGSVQLLDEIAATDPRIEVVDRGSGRLGTRQSFGALLRIAVDRGAEWTVLCDQDDVWQAGKLAAHRRLLGELSANPDDPWLLHSDLSVVGPDLVPVHASLLDYMRIRHEDEDALRTLLVQNFVTGCSAVASRGLLGLALPIPDESVMHDWWLALCAAASGRIGFDPEPRVLYRQHGANQVGAKPYRRSLTQLLARTLSLQRSSLAEVLATVRQAAALERRLEEGDQIDPGSSGMRGARDLVSAYVALFSPGVGRWRRVRGLRALKVGRQDPILNLALNVKLLTTSVPSRLDGSGSHGADSGARDTAASGPSGDPSHRVEQVRDPSL